MGELTSTPKRRLRSQREHLREVIARRKDPIATNLEPETPAMVIAAITGPATGVVTVAATQVIAITIAAVPATVITGEDSRGAIVYIWIGELLLH